MSDVAVTPLKPSYNVSHVVALSAQIPVRPAEQCVAVVVFSDVCTVSSIDANGAYDMSLNILIG